MNGLNMVSYLAESFHRMCQSPADIRTWLFIFNKSRTSGQRLRQSKQPSINFASILP